MWSLIIVETDEASYAFLSIFKTLVTLLPINDFRLQDAVHTFRYGIVCRLVIFSHTDVYLVFLQQIHVGIATILYTSVRVVCELGKIVGTRLVNGHLKSMDSMFRFKRFRQTPTHNLMRIGVRNQMQIATSVSKVYVGYIANPQSVSFRRNVTFNQILVLPVAMVGIGRLTGFGSFLKQSQTSEHSKECITSRHPIGSIHPLEHQPKLVIADAWIQLADFQHGVFDTHHPPNQLIVVCLALVIRLFATAKQGTGISDRVTEIPVQAFYCLAPDFFRIRIPCSSAMSIMTFKARFLS